jgi:hypothetical protein
MVWKVQYSGLLEGFLIPATFLFQKMVRAMPPAVKMMNGWPIV